LAFFGWVSTKTAGKFATWGFPAPNSHRDVAQKKQIYPANANHFGYEPMPMSFSLLVIFFDTDNLRWTYLPFCNFLWCLRDVHLSLAFEKCPTK